MISKRLAIALCAAIAAATATSADAQQSVTFRSPTGNIGCGYYLRQMRCDVTGGIVPRPPQPRPCEFGTWAGGYVVQATGFARAICTSDTTLGATHVLPYGKSRRVPGITCKAERIGVTCANRSGHGFFVSKGASHTF